MNLDIAATGPAPSAPTTTAERPGGLGTGDQHAASDVAAADAAVTVDAIPSSPPPEVMDAVAVAMQASERLTASGRALHFQVDPPTGKVTVGVHDLQGNLLSTVPLSSALDVAAGGSID